MRNIPQIFLVACTLIIFLAGPVLAGERGTKEEAKALVEKALAFYKQNGQEKTVAEANNPSGQFIDRDLYIFVLNTDGLRLAHGTNQKLVGKSILEIKDIDGKAYGQEIVQAAKASGTCWVDYKFTDPTTKKIAEKTTYCAKDNDLIFCSGAYKQ